MKRFVIGDIHGRATALREVLNKAKFNYAKDKLIILGDVVDGGGESKEAVDELLKIKNKILITGNHDIWFIDSYKKGIIEYIWTSQGGAATIKSYNDGIPESHKKFFEEGIYYHIEDGDKLFVHGGFDVWHNKKVQETSEHILVWDRDIIEFVRKGNTIPNFKEVYIGHTTTQLYGPTEPIKFNNLYLLDCGAGYNGRLCLMNIDTKKHYLSKIQVPVD
jgi:serine/threonine protein phosphatase 1